MEQTVNQKYFYRTLTRLTLPIAIQSLMLASVAAADALMLGQVAQEQMTAVSLATQVQFVQNMLLTGFTSGGAILAAQYFGKGDRRTMQDIFSLMLRASGFLSILFFLACEIIPQWLMFLFTSDAQLMEIGADYLRIAGWSYLITGISQCYLTIMKTSDHVLASAAISTTAVLTNILLNAVLIFGWFGIPAMEARGAATATTISRILELLLCLILTFRKDYIKPSFKKLFVQDKRLAHDFRVQYMLVLSGASLWTIGFSSYTAFIGHISPDAAAANAVAAVVRDLCCCVCNGMATAASIMVGNELGAGRLDAGRATGIRLCKISFLVGFSATAVVLATIPLVVRIVKLNETAHSYLVGMMIIMAIYMIGRCVNTIVINGIFYGGGDAFFDFYSLAAMMWGIAVPLSALGVFVFHWPVLVVYACTCMDEVVKIPWVMAHFRRYKWVKNLTFDRSDGEQP